MGRYTSEEDKMKEIDDFVPFETQTLKPFYWYEWIENMEKEFCTRLPAAMAGDATISQYCAAVPIVANEELDRFDLGVYTANSPATFVIHSPTQSIDKETGGHGRDNVVRECVVAAVVKKPGFDTTNHYEKALVGSSHKYPPCFGIATIEW